MSALTGNKNVDSLIAAELSDRELLNACIASPNTPICNDDNFWRDRLFKEHGRFDKSPDKNWKTFFLQVVYFTDKGKGSINRAMQLAARGGHKDLVEFYIKKGATTWNLGLQGAAEGGHKGLVDFFIEKGARNWEWGMYGAAQGGHQDLVKFFIDKGARNWDFGMSGAARGGREDLVEFFKQKLNKN